MCFVWQDFEGTCQRRSRLEVEGRISTKEARSRGHKRSKGDPASLLRRTDEGEARHGPPFGNWTYEIKLDGWRALALKGGSQARLLSRNEKDFGAKFPEVMDSIAKLNVQQAIIDGRCGIG